nr:ATP-grasp domain-containing protein [Methanocalculus taiwanensis]
MQTPAIKYAKHLGLYLAVTDKNKNAPGIQYSDRYEQIDGTDIDSLVNLAHTLSNDYELIGVYASSDFGLPAVAKISDIFDLPGVSEEVVSISLNKIKAKKVWKKFDLPVPIGDEVHSLDEMLTSVKQIGFPLILKPVDSCGSQGVRSASDQSELDQAYSETSSLARTIMIEQLVQGHHCDVNGLFIEGVFHPCGIFERFFSEPPLHYSLMGIQPSLLTELQESEVYAILESAARTLGIVEGPVKGDFIVTDHGPVILEVTPRFHGDVFTQWVTPNAVGVNPVEAWFAYLAKKPFTLTMKRGQHAGWRSLFPIQSGQLKGVEGIEESLKVQGVTNILISKKIGDMLKDPKDNTALCGFIWAKATNREELVNILDEASAKIKFIV